MFPRLYLLFSPNKFFLFFISLGPLPTLPPNDSLFFLISLGVFQRFHPTNSSFPSFRWVSSNASTQRFLHFPHSVGCPTIFPPNGFFFSFISLGFFQRFHPTVSSFLSFRWVVPDSLAQLTSNAPYKQNSNTPQRSSQVFPITCLTFFFHVFPQHHTRPHGAPLSVQAACLAFPQPRDSVARSWARSHRKGCRILSDTLQPSCTYGLSNWILSSCMETFTLLPGSSSLSNKSLGICTRPARSTMAYSS